MAKSNYSAKMKEIASSSLPPKQAHLAALGNFKDKLLHSQVLVVTYVQPEKTAGGIIIPDKSKDEDRYQGTLGLVVAMGPGAFKDDNIAKFHDVKLKIGNWVLYRPSDGLELFINQTPCRIFEDVHIKMIVESPELYW